VPRAQGNPADPQIPHDVRAGAGSTPRRTLCFYFRMNPMLMSASPGPASPHALAPPCIVTLPWCCTFTSLCFELGSTRTMPLLLAGPFLPIDCGISV
jgi:hypothetical protein